MWQPNVRVVKIGNCTVDPGKVVSLTHVSLKNQIGVGGGSTVTLVRHEGDVLLVDTGYEVETDISDASRERNWIALRTLLQFNGVDPADVTRVFITHFHWDHFGGIEHFGDAEWYCHSRALTALRHPIRDRFVPLDDGDRVMPNVVVVHTPGHTPGHSSLLCSTETGTVRVAICGDAIINLAWLQSGHLWTFNGNFHGVAEARRSIKKLLDSSDLIIPGHGQPFFVTADLRTQ